MSRHTAYRLLTGDDTAAFCHKVTAALAKGWMLYGTPSIAWDPEAKAMRSAQAVTKEVDGAYDPDATLGSL